MTNWSPTGNNWLAQGLRLNLGHSHVTRRGRMYNGSLCPDNQVLVNKKTDKCNTSTDNIEILSDIRGLKVHKGPDTTKTANIV